MNTDKNEIISTLNELIETCKDGEKGFRTCADAVDNNKLKNLFNDRAQHCAESAAELQKEVNRLGGKPEQTGSVGGSLHRGWVDLKSAATGKDESAVLDECERGEDVAVNSYEDALKEDLPMDIKAIVERQYIGAKRNHDMIRDLKRASHAGR